MKEMGNGRLRKGKERRSEDVGCTMHVACKVKAGSGHCSEASSRDLVEWRGVGRRRLSGRAGLSRGS
eukprot:scaffold173477_cov32-Tisochrysis_lutea.AAC.1